MRFWAILPCLLLICLIGTGVAEIEDRSGGRLKNDFRFPKEDASDEVYYSVEHDEVGLFSNGINFKKKFCLTCLTQFFVGPSDFLFKMLTILMLYSVRSSQNSQI